MTVTHSQCLVPMHFTDNKLVSKQVLRSIPRESAGEMDMEIMHPVEHQDMHYLYQTYDDDSSCIPALRM